MSLPQNSSIKFNLNSKEISFILPKEWKILNTLIAKSMRGITDVNARLIRNLNNPIESSPLCNLISHQKKILIAVDDNTRPTPVYAYIDCLIQYLLENGANKENIKIIIAAGVHKKMSDSQICQKLGRKTADTMQIIQHNCHNEGENTYLGVTKNNTYVSLSSYLLEADLILLLGSIEPHRLVGFGGGLKMIVPGLASSRTIADNHNQGISPERFDYTGDVNAPMRKDLEQASLMIKKDIFIINTLLNENKEIINFFCGHPVSAHRKGVAALKSICGVSVREKADVVILSSNPLNSDLRQGMKTIGNVQNLVKKGGIIIAILECTDGTGDIAVPTKVLPYKIIRYFMRLAGSKSAQYLTAYMYKKAGPEEKSIINIYFHITRKADVFVFSPNLSGSFGKNFGFFRSFTSIKKMIKEAAKGFPKNKTVYVIPSAGSTFPVFE